MREEDEEKKEKERKRDKVGLIERERGWWKKDKEALKEWQEQSIIIKFNYGRDFFPVRAKGVKILQSGFKDSGTGACTV